VLRVAVKASGSGGVQRVRAWQRGRSDLDRRPRAVFSGVVVSSGEGGGKRPAFRGALATKGARSSYG